MRVTSMLLVCVATPLVCLAALLVLPVEWLAVGGALFVGVGAVLAYVARSPRRSAELTPHDEPG